MRRTNERGDLEVPKKQRVVVCCNDKNCEKCGGQGWYTVYE